MDLPDEIHAAMLALGAPSEGIRFMNEAEAARLRAQLDVRVAAAEHAARRANEHKGVAR